MQTGLRILLIESDELIADVTSYRLQLLGYRVTVVSASVSVWSTIERFNPHGILLNLDSDAFDGFSLLEEFSSDPRTSEIPVLALSSDADLDRVEHAWKGGARDYLLTPYDPLTLERKVARLLDGVEATGEGPAVADRESAAFDDQDAEFSPDAEYSGFSPEPDDGPGDVFYPDTAPDADGDLYPGRTGESEMTAGLVDSGTHS